MNEIEQNLSYRFSNPELLLKALTHKSFHNEQGSLSKGHNEKLEFLGDAVIDLVLSELLMETFPMDSEGNLSKKRASLVNESVLCEVSKSLNLPQYLQMGKGEILTGGDKKPRLMASCYEALIGAVFMDGGFAQARDLARRHFAEMIGKMDPTQDYESDYKTRLQELVQSQKKQTAPVYELIKEKGPAHDRTFLIVVRVAEQEVARGEGKSKKQAEQEAARLAIMHFQSSEEKQSGEKH